MLQSLISAISSTFKGNDGKISSRKTTAFWFVIIATVQSLSIIIMQWLIITRAVVISDTNTRAMSLLYDFYVATLAMILLLFGIITFGQIQSLKTIVNAEKKDKPENEPEQ
jgi:hypothetical protein